MDGSSDPAAERRDVGADGEGERLDRWLQACDLGPSRSQWQRLIDEATKARRISHRNVVRVLAGSVNGTK